VRKAMVMSGGEPLQQAVKLAIDWYDKYLK
jgi:hypothetical protein